MSWVAPTGVSVSFYEIERQTNSAGPWQILESDIWVDSGTADQLTKTYYVDENVGNDTYQYRIRYYDGAAYSDYSYSGIIGKQVLHKIGYTFGNYVVPTDQWGVAGTPDDMRYTYLYGINMSAQNGQEFKDSQLQFYINAAVEDFERYLGIIIRRRRFITQPDDDVLTQVKWWSNGCDYTDEDDPYRFDPDVWRDGYGQLKLRNFPVISLSRAKMYTETDQEILDLLTSEWTRLNKSSGLITEFPKIGVGALGPFTQGGLFFRTIYRVGYPHGFKFDYDAGFKDSDRVPEDLREAIMMWAAVKTLSSVGDGLLAGFSSSSISLDGLSESFSSTQSATSAYFGARILSYTKAIKEYLKLHKYQFDNMPMGFV